MEIQIIKLTSKTSLFLCYNLNGDYMKKVGLVFLLILIIFLVGCSNEKNTSIVYSRSAVHQVKGRQGICTDGNYYWVSGSTTLTKYDKDWNVLKENTNPFKGYELEVNHIGDIDVYNNELYLGVEYFVDGIGKNIQVAVYDGDTLELKRVFKFNSKTGQLECSGIAVDSEHGYVYMVSWIDDESSNYIYKYDLNSEKYLGKILMDQSPKWIQGIAYNNNYLYVTADDGDADKDEPDNMYKIEINKKGTEGTVTLEKTFDDVIKQGEIEGLSFNPKNNKFLLLYNRGAKIVKGMPKGFYEGYTEEIHEVFVYDIKKK